MLVIAKELRIASHTNKPLRGNKTEDAFYILEIEIVRQYEC